MQTTPPQTQEGEQEKKKNSRRDLVALLKQLKKLCGRFKSAEAWIDFAQKEVTPLLEKHQASLPEGVYPSLKKAARLPESTRAGANQACRILQAEIKQVLPFIPKTGGASAIQIAAGLIAGAAVVAGAGVLAYNMAASTIIIQNTGCGNIPVASQAPAITGFLLPPSIPEGGTNVKFPPGKITVDSSQPNLMTLQKVVTLPSWPIDSVVSVLFDGTQELVGGVTILDLKPGAEYSLEVTCQGTPG